MQTSLKEKEEEGGVLWEPMQPATHPAFAILPRSSHSSPARQHPRDRSDGCMSQGWVWGRGDPAFAAALVTVRNCPSPAAPEPPASLSSRPATCPSLLAVTQDPTSRPPGRPGQSSWLPRGWGAGRPRGGGCTPAPTPSLGRAAPRVRAERQDPSASSFPREHPE